MKMKMTKKKNKKKKEKKKKKKKKKEKKQKKEKKEKKEKKRCDPSRERKKFILNFFLISKMQIVTSSAYNF